ncbi:outer membrane lipoprotein chaperone LolA [Wenzhouxiangella sp. AB-CW3]|uniref:outer membrane lipoprotein chaperone LolA n=1 Tax=Wenzhouxiangella sp. AB-CW3 TaxID=2771012 RepID=UPI00168AE562|nr:outer membrane lipoprotein chaperone LolA [Wenzhouxiangella sp. AB-CW3]QOC21139.1 outer membrane lipoprotein chaperone LolA [Wenzhouxiangella sp. AB-CW3]
MHRSLIALALMTAATLGWADAREQLERFAENLETLSGEFEQVTIDDSGRVIEEVEGQLYFSRPDRFRWDYESPFPQQMVADGEQLWHFDESLDQVTVRDQPDAAESPLLVLTRPELLDRFYSIEDTGDDQVIQFLPLADDADFERARLHFRDEMPELLELHDQFGQITRIRLIRLQRNPEIDAEVFTFEPPPGVDVLEGY